MNHLSVGCIDFEDYGRESRHPTPPRKRFPHFNIHSQLSSYSVHPYTLLNSGPSGGHVKHLSLCQDGIGQAQIFTGTPSDIFCDEPVTNIPAHQLEAISESKHKLESPSSPSLNKPTFAAIFRSSSIGGGEDIRGGIGDRGNGSGLARSKTETPLTIFRNWSENRKNVMLKGRKRKRISFQAIFMQTPQVDAIKDAPGVASFDGAGRASTSDSVARLSVDSSTSTSTTTTTDCSNSNVAKSLPSRGSPPPSFLLDDDPFANLTPITVGSRSTRHRSESSVGSIASVIPHSQRPPPIHPELAAAALSLPAVSAGLPAPKSRLQETVEVDGSEAGSARRARSQEAEKEKKVEGGKRKRAKTFFVTMSAPVSPSKSLFASPKVPVPPLPEISESISLPSSPALPDMSSSRTSAPPPTTRTFAIGKLQPRPAHQRPAFAARPSLPSLDTLAKMNVVLTTKVRKGHVGAGLPFEPWDNLPDDELNPLTSPSATPTTALPMNCDDSIPIDRTPTSTPFSTIPSSPVRSCSSSTISSSSSSFVSSIATPPTQPLLPSQILSLGPLVEDMEIDTTRSRSNSRSPPLLGPSLVRTDKNVFSILTGTPVEIAAPVAILPSVPEASVTLQNLDGNLNETKDVSSGTDCIEDLLDTYGFSDTFEKEPHRFWIPESDPASISVDQLTMQSRWSLETYDSNIDSQPLSPVFSTSDGSSIPSYPYGYDYGYSNSDMDSMTDVSRDLSLSRSISSASISSTSVTEEGESNEHDLGRLHGRIFNPSENIFDHLLPSLSKLPVSSSSGSNSGGNSILHTPDSEWTFLAQQQLYPPHNIPDILDVFPQSDFAVADHQPQPQAQTQVEITTLQNYGQADVVGDYTKVHPNISNDDAKKSNWPVTMSHTTADDLNLSTRLSPISNSLPFLQHDCEQEYRFSSLGVLIDPDIAIASNNQTSLGSVGLQPQLLSDSAPGASQATLSSPPLLHSSERQERYNNESAHLDEMGNGSELRENLYGTDRGHGHRSPSAAPVLHNAGSGAPIGSRRGSNVNGEDERRRQIMLLQMRRELESRPSFESNEYDENKYGSNRSTDVGAASGSRSASTSISKTASTSACFLHQRQLQRFPSTSNSHASSTSDEDEEDELSSSDDDIPLAQRIPSALTAQQSIRKQVKAEREAKRAARAKKQRERQITLRPAGAGARGGAGSISTDFSSSQEAALSAVAALSSPVVKAGAMNTTPGPPLGRSGSKQHRRMTTMPNQFLRPSAGDFGQAFNAEDLARKLQTVKMLGEGPNLAISSPTAAMKTRQQHHQQSPLQLSHSNTLRRSESKSRRPHDHSQSASAPISVPPVMGLKTKRSLHALDAEHRSHETVFPQKYLLNRSMSTGRSDKERTSGRRELDEVIPPLPNTATLNGRVSLDDQRENDRGRRVFVKPYGEPRVSGTDDVERHRERINVNDTSVVGAPDALVTSKHRIFIHSLQYPYMVDIRADTSAGDLIASLEMEGVLDSWAGLGGWMIWEIAQDFGMERPVRGYELLVDIQSSWLKEKTVNYLLLKKTALSVPLDRSAIPSSAPMHSGWVECETRRGKWSKRWLHLKENSLYLSKKDGRDDTLLCSLSNFDAYYITRSHRAPKPFAFTIKSTDNLSFFEDAADYMHNFSCSEKDGQVWVEKILVARSYVLYQERNALFNPKASTTVATGVASVSRSGTKKTKPAQPLVNLSSGDIFEPGSLLSPRQPTIES